MIGIDYDPADDNKRIRAHVKSNNALTNKRTSFTIESAIKLHYARKQWHGDIQVMTFGEAGFGSASLRSDASD